MKRFNIKLFLYIVIITFDIILLILIYSNKNEEYKIQQEIVENTKQTARNLNWDYDFTFGT